MGIRDELEKFEDVHKAKVKETDEKIHLLSEQVAELERWNEDKKDEIELKNNEIEKLMSTKEENEHKDSCSSLADELDAARSEDQWLKLKSWVVINVILTFQVKWIWKLTLMKLMAHYLAGRLY